MIQENEDTFDLNEKVLITFKNEEYVLNAYALLSKDGGLSSKESLVISIKKESTNEIWKGKYTNNCNSFLKIFILINIYIDIYEYNIIKIIYILL